jgi:MFS family permease
VTVHLVLAALVVSPSAIVAATRFLPEHDYDHSDVMTNATSAEAAGSSNPSGPVDRRGAFAAWREPRTLLIGVFVLAFAFAEGVANDWIAVAVIDDHHASEAVGTLGFAVFLASMTVGRWFGPALLDRYGRVAVVRAIVAVGIAGTMLFVLAPVTWLAIVGTALWGLGASLGFPVGMSAGADEPALAASRVSVISSIGYCAFLAGPPLIGFLGDQITVLRALVSVTVLLTLAAVIAPVVENPLLNDDHTS